jgi:hypothetical protein
MLARGGSDALGLRDVQTIDAVERDVFQVACGGVNLSRPDSEQFLRKYQTESSVCAGYELN